MKSVVKFFVAFIVIYVGKWKDSRAKVLPLISNLPKMHRNTVENLATEVFTLVNWIKKAVSSLGNQWILTFLNQGQDCLAPQLF